MLFLAATLAFAAPNPLLAQAPPIKTLSPSQASAQRNGETKAAAESDPLLTRAKSLADNGMAADAERETRQYLAAHPDSADAHFLLGYIFFREIQQQARRVTPQASTASEIATPAAASYDEKATGTASHDEKTTGNPDLSFREAKARASLAQFTEGAKYRDPSAFDLKIVALDYILLGDYRDADKWLTRMLEWTPGDSEGWYELGRTKYNENRFDEAVGAFQKSLKLDPQNIKTEDNLGLAYAGLGRTDDAAAAYSTAIAWEKAADAAHKPTTQQTSTQKDAAQKNATQNDTTQNDIASKNPGPFIDMASLLLDQNRTAEAVRYLNQAIEISPRDAKAHELLGKAYSRLDHLPQAQSELEKAIELAPQNPNLPCMLGPLYRKQGQIDKAKTQLDRCAALNGTHSSPEPPRP